MALSRLNRTLLGLVAIAGLLGVGIGLEAQQSPSSDTVAKPRKKGKDGDLPEPDQTKIPSKLNKKKDLPDNLPTFRSDVNSVSVEVAVMDNKGNFIPKIPGGNFRVYEDDVPQKTT